MVHWFGLRNVARFDQDVRHLYKGILQRSELDSQDFRCFRVVESFLHTPIFVSSFGIRTAKLGQPQQSLWHLLGRYFVSLTPVILLQDLTNLSEIVGVLTQNESLPSGSWHFHGLKVGQCDIPDINCRRLDQRHREPLLEQDGFNDVARLELASINVWPECQAGVDHHQLKLLVVGQVF